jgi:hypothetical protein
MRVNTTWALAAAVLLATAAAADQSVLKFRIGAFSTDRGMPSYKEVGLERLEAVKSGEEAYYIVQFHRPPDDGLRALVESFGGKVFDYIPNCAHVVRMAPERRVELEKAGFVRFLAYYQPAFRISPDLLAAQSSAPEEEPGTVKLTVITFEVADRAPVRDRLLAEEPDVRFFQEDAIGRIFQVTVPEGRASEIARKIAHFTEVQWVERLWPSVLHNAWSRWINQSRDTTGMGSSNSTWQSKLRIKSADDSLKMPIYRRGLYGQGQIVHVDDTGMDWDNIYTRDPGGLKPVYDKDLDTVCEATNSHRKIVAYNVIADTFDLNSSGHGTHTTGSVAADSMGSTHSGALSDTVLARAMGMAPMARIAFSDIGGASDALYIPTNRNDIYRWGYNAGARISSSSWGGTNGQPSSYNYEAQGLDTLAWQHQDYLMFRSAGNSNPNDSVNRPATGKNIVCVGANESGFGTGTTWAATGVTTRNEIRDVAEFSSHGPTREGLLRPHLLASGGWYIWSVDSDGSLTTNNNGYTYMGGTSMSTPTTAGLCALARQYLTEGWWRTGTKQAGDAIANPPGPLMKALMILSTRNTPGAYSADALGSTGTKNVPSQGQGWGAVVLDDALYFLGDARKLRIDDTRSFTASGQSQSYTVTTGPSTDTMNTFKVVLSYFDYPGALAPGDISVNNLDLTVSDGTNTYRGNVFGSNGKSTTGGSADTLNNDEVVWLLPSAAKGNRTLTITVTATTIIHSPQPYSIVVAGDIASSTNFRSDPLAVYFAGMSARASQTGIEVMWRTESEENCFEWRVERSESPEAGYKAIGRLPGRGTTTVPHDYKYEDQDMTISGVYYYRLVEVDLSGRETVYGPVSAEWSGGPAEYRLMDSHPNPLGLRGTTIRYALKEPGLTTLEIFNVAGQRVRTLVNGRQPANYYAVSWDGSNDRGKPVANGVYFYRLKSGEFSDTKKMIVVR